ncbi:MAG: carbohydrate ABC transporter permease [Lachnospiraceae bacterium]|nr:carbohydrate ABC transporter permease [Lachnospiraceae bacterium]
MKSKTHEIEVPRMKMKKSRASQIFDFCNALFMILFCITIIIPFWDVVVRSFSRAQDISYMHINFLPKVWTLDAYRYCFQDNEIISAFFMSVLRTVAGTAVHVMVCCMAAYALTRTDMPFRRAITALLLIPMFFSAGMIPAYLNMKRLGLLNNFMVYILPTGFSIYNTIIIRNYFFSIDKGMEEAASIDGASQVRIFTSIIMPLSKPVIATVALWQMVGQWNAWFDNMIYCRRSASLTTLQYLLRRMLDSMTASTTTSSSGVEAIGALVDSNPDTVKAATTLLVVLPIVAIYPFLQKYFVQGIMVGAVKG